MNAGVLRSIEAELCGFGVVLAFVFAEPELLKLPSWTLYPVLSQRRILLCGHPAAAWCFRSLLF